MKVGDRVLAKPTGRLGTIRHVSEAAGQERYLVIYDEAPESLRDLEPEVESGQDFPAEDLEPLQ